MERFNFINVFKDLVSNLKPGLTKDIFRKELELASGLEIQQENPDTLLRDTGDRELAIYDLMLLDDRVSMAINLKKRLALSVPAAIVPASEDEKDIEIATEIENQLKVNGESVYKHEAGYSFWSSVDNMMDALSYGFKVAEKIWKIDDAKLVLNNLKFKHSRFYDFDYDEFANINKLLIGKNYGYSTEIESEEKIYSKFMICTYPYVKDGNFYGNSELMPIYDKWRSKKHIQKQRDITLEKWGSPIPEAIYDASKMSSSEKNSLQDLLDNWQEGTYFLTPGFRNPKTGEMEPKIQFKLHEVKSGNIGRAFDDAIDQLDKQITRTILFPDKLGFSESPGGSYNQAETQLDLLQVVIEYTHQWIETIINNQLIKQIVDMNYNGITEYPVFKFDRISDKIKSEMLESLINLGVVDKREKWIRHHVGIPILSEKEQEEIEKQKEEDRENMPMMGGESSKEEKEDKESNEEEEPQADKRLKIFKRKGNPFRSREVKKWMDTQEDEFVVDYAEIMKGNYEAIVKQIERKKIVDDKNLKAKEALRMPKTELKNYLTNKFSQWYFSGKKQSISELENRPLPEQVNFKKVSYNLEGQTSINGENLHNHEYMINEIGNGSTITTNGEAKSHVHEILNFQVLPSADGHVHDLNSQISMSYVSLQTEVNWLNKVFIDRFLGSGNLSKLTTEDIEQLKIIRDKGFTITGIEEEKMLKEINFIIDSGIRSGLTTQQVVKQILEKADNLIESQALTIARTNMADQYNAARINFFTSKEVSPIVEAYQYQAIIDENTTDFCASHDGQVIKASDPRVAQINPPNHFNCRSTLVPILLGDNTDKNSFFYNYRDNTVPFGTDVPKNATQPEIGFGGSGNK